MALSELIATEYRAFLLLKVDEQRQANEEIRVGPYALVAPNGVTKAAMATSCSLGSLNSILIARYLTFVNPNTGVEMTVNVWFLSVFIIAWLAAPVTQAIFLVAPRLHHKLGMTEENAFKPEFRWFLLDEKAIAIADMTYLVSGGIFIWLALVGSETALIFGFYSCACYVYIAVLAISRWRLFGSNDLSPIAKGQLPVYMAYMVFFFVFGLYGLFYLWGLV